LANSARSGFAGIWFSDIQHLWVSTAGYRRIRVSGWLGGLGSLAGIALGASARRRIAATGERGAGGGTDAGGGDRSAGPAPGHHEAPHLGW
jgi:hypothetical protein